MYTTKTYFYNITARNSTDKVGFLIKNLTKKVTHTYLDRVSSIYSLSTIQVKNQWTNGKICSKVALHTESVKFRSQRRETASKRKPYRGLDTLGSHPRDNGIAKKHYSVPLKKIKLLTVFL